MSENDPNQYPFIGLKEVRIRSTESIQKDAADIATRLIDAIMDGHYGRISTASDEAWVLANERRRQMEELEKREWRRQEIEKHRSKHGSADHV